MSLLCYSSSSKSPPRSLLSSSYKFSFPSSSSSLHSLVFFSTKSFFLLRLRKAFSSKPRSITTRLSISSMISTSYQSHLSKDCLQLARAYWISRSLIAWNTGPDDASVFLYSSKTANLSVTDNEEDEKIELEYLQSGLPTNIIHKFPHVGDYNVYKVPDYVDVYNLLKSQLAVASFYANGECSNATSLQLPGVLDELFAYTGPLGAIYGDDSIMLYLWAPTAQAVCACIFKDSLGRELLEQVPLEELNGVWSASGTKCWDGCYYVYKVSVYHPSTLRIETCIANDPYAKGLSSDGRRSLFLDLECEDLKPSGWVELADEKPALSSFSDISIYELHIRDFSANDRTVKPEFRGGYLAFTSKDSAGVLHLKELSDAGLTHVHLLPSFHFTGVDDEKEKWKSIDEVEMSKLPPDSKRQQEEVTAIQDEDGYNWGYNPVLWGIPKGSYATNANGPCRILEFRKMIQALNRMGLRVILDVVYNHLNSSGPHDENSVLDKVGVRDKVLVVPGYYLRRNTDGCIEHSTCMNNTASENFMVERLILDDLLRWAVAYKVDGFRFDLMGHIMKSTMINAKNVIHSLSKKESGVDGSKIYVYGEGWDFGEVAKNKRGINASQFNMSGTGIGSFNDRLRDAVLGGSPFGHPLQQGFATGLSLEPNDYDYGRDSAADNMLSSSVDHIQVGLAANLRDIVLTSRHGEAMKGSEILTHDAQPVGYASNPTETINYVSAHDNETLFDIISLKTPLNVSVDDRCRINHHATSIVALSQGIPFFHAGDELLRSKSLDRDSYNSGDWFNRLDFTYESNNLGIGLPPREKNEKNWPLIKPRLANPSFKPKKSHIVDALENFTNLLKIRYSSPLFRLCTANSIQERIRFHNVGPSWLPGSIVMSIEDGHAGAPGIAQLDPNYSFIVVIFNASPSRVSLPIPALRNRKLQLHPIQLKSSDKLVKESSYEASSGSFFIPQRTTAVFIEPRSVD